MQVRNLRNRLRVNIVCEWAWVSIPGERDLPKSLNWCSRLELRSRVQVCTHARTHIGKRAHVLLITMALKLKQKVDVQSSSQVKGTKFTSRKERSDLSTFGLRR